MTRQKIYNKVRDHLLKQNAKSRRGSGCAYRGDNGRMCAVGCLISNAKYSPRMEGTRVGALYSPHAKAVYGFAPLSRPSESTCSLLMSLQDVHDHSHPPQWPEKLRSVALAYGLKP